MLLEDGDPAGLERDALLYMGSLGSLRKTARLLERSDTLPRVCLAWNTEPMPPPELNHRWERLGVALSPASLGITWAKPLLHMVSGPMFWMIGRAGLPAGLGRQLSPGALRFSIENLAVLERGLKAGWITHVIAATEQQRQYLAERGLDASFIPSGIHDGYGCNLGGPRDIDVLFIGRLKNNKRRQRSLDRMLAALEKRSLTVHVVSRGCFGQERTKLVNRAKVVLHLHSNEWESPFMRWYLATANGAIIASEPLRVSHPLDPHTHYISAPLQELPDAICAVLANDTRRMEIFDSCRTRITEKMSLVGSVRAILDLMSKHSIPSQGY